MSIDCNEYITMGQKAVFKKLNGELQEYIKENLLSKNNPEKNKFCTPYSRYSRRL